MAGSAAGSLFQGQAGHPDLLAGADLGSEIQIFDPETLRMITYCGPGRRVVMGTSGSVGNGAAAAGA